MPKGNRSSRVTDRLCQQPGMTCRSKDGQLDDGRTADSPFDKLRASGIGPFKAADAGSGTTQTASLRNGGEQFSYPSFSRSTSWFSKLKSNGRLWSMPSRRYHSYVCSTDEAKVYSGSQPISPRRRSTLKKTLAFQRWMWGATFWMRCAARWSAGPSLAQSSSMTVAGT